MPKQIVTEAEIYDAIERVAEHIDAGRNDGIYRRMSSPIAAHEWVLNPKWKAWRDGVLYYSKGHGWRCRKKPHWRDVLAGKREAMPPVVTLDTLPE